MNCHECARVGRESPAVATCQYCSVGLCKQHLVDSLRSTTAPLYTCEHQPQRAFRAAPVGSDVERATTGHQAP